MSTNRTASVAIMSGKGGVGKTNIALNLSYALHMTGATTLLMDCDMGLANLDVLLGITPEGNLEDVLAGRLPLAQALHHVTPDGFDVLPASSGMPELIDLDADMRALLLRRLEPVLDHYDYVFMDLGAGITDTVQSFAAMAAMRVVVITPEPTSLTDSYALIKVLAARHNVRDYMVVVNQIYDNKEGDMAYGRLRGACRRFLNIEPVLLGYVRGDPNLPEAVRRQKPLMSWSADSPAGQDLRAAAEGLRRIKASMQEWLAPRPVLRVLKD